MIERIQLQKYIEVNDVAKSGLWLVEYNGWNGMQNELWYVNKKTNLMLVLENEESLDRDMMAHNGANTKVMVLDQANSSNITEDFFLKALALARIDSKEIKIDNILN